MSLVSVLIPVTMILVGCGVWAFFWAVRNGQFDELDVPAWEILVAERTDTTTASTVKPEDPS
jgi:cbb3-type cytochrome oxidase maturation protein